MYTISVCKKNISLFVSANKKLYFLSLVVFLIGLVLGVVLVSIEQMEEEVYSSVEISLVSIIKSDYSGFSLFISSLFRVLIPLVIIYILSLSRFTMWLGTLYYGYQATLLGASITTLVVSSGMAGLLNALFVVLPINFINFFLVASGLVIFLKRYKLAKFQRLSIFHSTKIFLPKILALLAGIVFSAFCYGFIYPFLLKSVVIINV